MNTRPRTRCKTLATVPPDELLARLSTVKHVIARAWAANIIWADYCHRWPDGYNRQPWEDAKNYYVARQSVKVQSLVMIKALMAAGLDEIEAKERIKVIDDYNRDKFRVSVDRNPKRRATSARYNKLAESAHALPEYPVHLPGKTREQ